MMLFRTMLRGAALSLPVVLAAASTSSAATSFSNSLKGFTGDSTQAATQAAVAAAGFDFFSIDGLNVEFTKDPAVTFDANGAGFGVQWALDGGGGDGGRNYVRTIQSDYATTNFVAEITFTTTDDIQDVFVGLGAGDTALFGTPDWSTQFSSASFWPQTGNNKIVGFKTANDVNSFDDANNVIPGFDPGVHRLRMTFDSAAKTLVATLDMNYAGGAFTVDYTKPTIDVSTLFGDEVGIEGWPTEPSRIFFGGDDGAIFKDFSVTVGSAATGDFDNDGDVDGADFLSWQKGFGMGPGATLAQGDADGNGTVNGADLDIWKAQFGPGAAVSAVSAVPEPSVCVLVSLAGASLLLRRRLLLS